MTHKNFLDWPVLYKAQTNHFLPIAATAPPLRLLQSADVNGVPNLWQFWTIWILWTLDTKWSVWSKIIQNGPMSETVQSIQMVQNGHTDFFAKTFSTIFFCWYTLYVVESTIIENLYVWIVSLVNSAGERIMTEKKLTSCKPLEPIKTWYFMTAIITNTIKYLDCPTW